MVETFLEPWKVRLPVAREGALEEASDQAWVVRAEVSVVSVVVSLEADAEGLLAEAVEEFSRVAMVAETASVLLEYSSAEALAKALCTVG